MASDWFHGYRCHCHCTTATYSDCYYYCCCYYCCYCHSYCYGYRYGYRYRCCLMRARVGVCACVCGVECMRVVHEIKVIRLQWHKGRWTSTALGNSR